LNPYLKPIEQKEAVEKLAKYQKGMMLVQGDEGAGKDIFLHLLAYKMRRYFGKHVGLDQPPREAFDGNLNWHWNNAECKWEFYGEDGQYWKDCHPHFKFSPSVMTEVFSHIDGDDDEAFNIWWDEIGCNLLNNSVLGMSEFWRYVQRRRAMNKSNLMMGGLIRVHRHYNMLIIGNTQAIEDLDVKMVLQRVSSIARCKWLGNNTTEAKVQMVKFAGEEGLFKWHKTKPDKFTIDGAERRDMFNGKRVYDIFNSASRTSITLGGR